MTTAALILGAAVSSSAKAASCRSIPVEPGIDDLADIEMIVIGTVRTENGGGLARIEPESFLKGAASREPVRPRYPPAEGECPLARLEDGARIAAFLTARDGAVAWPEAGQVFWLSGGDAVRGGPSPTTTRETTLITNVRHITGQFAVPAETPGEGASIDWVGTVLPVGGGLLVVFAISLVLMRVWHRIDPT